MVLYYLFTTLYVFVCLVLLLVILLQQGKGDMAGAFGGGSSQTAFGARAGATVLSKATAVLAVLFMLGALVLAVIGQRGPGSVLSGTPGPPPAPAASSRTRDTRGDDAGTGGEQRRQQHDPAGRDTTGDPSGDAATGAAAAGKIRPARSPSPLAEVAERQTHQLEGLAGATPWRFESSLPHHSTRPRLSPRPRSWQAESRSPRLHTISGRSHFTAESNALSERSESKGVTCLHASSIP